MNLLDNVPALHIQSNEDGTIMLEQSAGGNAERVAIHPVHVRHLAERLGMVREVSASDAELLRTERGHVAGLRLENDRLKRNMLRLREHALALQHDFAEHADWKHADLVEPMNQINGVVALFDMACDDFADDYDAHEPSGNPGLTKAEPVGSDAARSPVRPPKLGCFGTPPKTDGFTPADPAPPQKVRPRSSRAGQPLQLDLDSAHGK